MCFSRELQQPENPTLASFKAEKPSLDVRTKFGGIDAKKKHTKKHTKMGVAWGSVVLNGPQRVKFFFVKYKKIFRGVSP